MNAVRSPTIEPAGPLRILAAARSLPFHSVGGMQALAWDVLRGLAACGHRVTVLTTLIPGRSAARFEADGVDVVPLANTVPERYSGGWWRATRRYVLGPAFGGADAVLSVSSAAAGLLPLKASLLRAPFVFQAHGSSWAEARAKWASGRPLDWLKSARNVYWLANDARIYPRFDEIVLVGDALAKQFEAAPLRWLTRGIRKTTIVNGIDAQLFRYDGALRAATRARFRIATDELLVVFAARLHAHKGAAELLRALAILRTRDPKYRALVIGDGPERLALERLAEELGCREFVSFAGSVDRARVPALLAAGDVFAFPALGREGLPLNVLEALSLGMQCVVAQSLRATFGALSGVVYADPLDARAFADAIDRAVLRGGTRSSLLPPEYSLDRCVAAYEAVLHGAVER